MTYDHFRSVYHGETVLVKDGNQVLSMCIERHLFVNFLEEEVAYSVKTGYFINLSEGGYRQEELHAMQLQINPAIMTLIQMLRLSGAVPDRDWETRKLTNYSVI